MKKKEESVKQLIEKIKTLEELTGDKKIRDHKKIEELINKYLSRHVKSYSTRTMNIDEKKVLTPDAFSYLLELVGDKLLSYNEFEKVINQLIQYSYAIEEPIDGFTMVSLLEMMSYTDFQENMMDQIMQMYINSPDILHNLKFTLN